MSDTLLPLLRLLDLERMEADVFRGVSRDIGSGRVFGGQVLAQALVAARRTVEGPREAHSMHGYFLLPGDLAAPIVYRVDRLRDGRSFTTRRVNAVQAGRVIFSLSASFHAPESGPEHQAPMPEVTPPEQLVDELERIRAVAGRLPERLRAVYTQPRPLEFRAVDPSDLFRPAPRPPLKHAWLRACSAMPDDPLLHQAVLAYASDYGLLGAALLPHRIALQDPAIQAATLDHAIWFHRPFRIDEWLLYEMESPSAFGARGFARGSVYRQDGVRVASVTQEGLIRPRAAR